MASSFFGSIRMLWRDSVYLFSYFSYSLLLAVTPSCDLYPMTQKEIVPKILYNDGNS